MYPVPWELSAPPARNLSIAGPNREIVPDLAKSQPAQTLRRAGRGPRTKSRFFLRPPLLGRSPGTVQIVVGIAVDRRAAIDRRRRQNRLWRRTHGPAGARGCRGRRLRLADVAGLFVHEGHLANALLHLLARLEGDDILRLDVHLVAGARIGALRALRRFTSNTPNLRNSIRFSVIKVSMIALKVCCTISFVFNCGMPVLSEIILTISFLVTVASPRGVALGSTDRFKCRNGMG